MNNYITITIEYSKIYEVPQINSKLSKAFFKDICFKHNELILQRDKITS